MLGNTTPPAIPTSDSLSETDRILRAVSSLVKQFVHDNTDKSRKGKGKEEEGKEELGVKQQRTFEYCMRILGR